MKYRIALSALVLSLPLCVRAEGAVGLVESVGCHNTDNVCWVQVNGFSTSACNQSSQLRWDAGTAWGARWYATFLAAHLSGKRVFLEVAGYCTPQGYPTFMYGSVAD
jgi:hypothetical protein